MDAAIVYELNLIRQTLEVLTAVLGVAWGTAVILWTIHLVRE